MQSGTLNNIKSGTINDITNLKFYIDNGIEIPMQKNYVLTWEFIPDNVVSKYMQEAPKGYFIADISITDTTIQLLKNSLLTSFINNGQFKLAFAAELTVDENGITIFGYNDDNTPKDYFDYLKKLLFEFDNKVRISINLENETYTSEYPFIEIFEFADDESTVYSDYYKTIRINIGDNTTTHTLDSSIVYEKEYFEFVLLAKIDLVHLLVKVEREGKSIYEKDLQSYIEYMFMKRIPNLYMYFPFVQYSGCFFQERVSSDFIASNTIIVLENFIEYNEEKQIYEEVYTKPYISTDSKYNLAFSPIENAELKLISPETTYDIQYSKQIGFSLADEINDYVGTPTPFTFAIAFLASTEGAYENHLGIYITSQENSLIRFYMGTISVKSEVEGEDERFRTLLGNFGIPDPVDYSNLFSKLDFAEEGKDYKLVNEKSKELFLTYTDIFSYVGTYKALLNAIKFLGYTDIVFKEWYTLLDSNDAETDIAVLVFDSETGEMLKLKLAQFGVSIEDFKRYNKLNKLTMIYHLNQIDEGKNELLQTVVSLWQKPVIKDGKVVKNAYIKTALDYLMITPVPLTSAIYSYRNEETLAKLYSVKKWLEKNIIGVGAYISEISGEGIYFGWQKTQGYHTRHDLADFSSELYYTPDVKKVSEFRNSECKISCTLNELNNAVCIEDYERVPFEAFIKYELDLSTMKDTNNVHLDCSTLKISNTIESPVLGEEYEFDLVNAAKYGSLAEWTTYDTSVELQIYVNEDNINLIFGECEESILDSSNAPIITLENANIHRCYGDWRSNSEWSVKEIIDENTGNTIYNLKNQNEGKLNNFSINKKQYVILKPIDSSTVHSYIKYTTLNNYRVPLFVLHGYKFNNVYESDFESIIDSSNYEKIVNLYAFNGNEDYILEITKGDMLFRNKSINSNPVGLQLSFTNENAELKLEITPYYTYHSDRVQFTVFDASKINEEITNNFDYSAEIQKVIDCSQAIQNIFNNIALDISTLVNSNLQNIAYEEAINFINNDASFKNEIKTFIDKKLNNTEKNNLYIDFEKIAEKYYTFNQNIDISVNRLGTYNIIGRAFDRYNNTYVNKFNKSTNVTTKPFNIELISGQAKSNNTEEFYKSNKNGQKLTTYDINNLLNNTKEHEIPKLQNGYKLISYINNRKEHTVNSDIISYAAKNIKSEYQISFENSNILCTSAKMTSKNVAQLQLLDSNKFGNLYEDSSINIVFYDENTLRDIDIIGPFKVRKFKKAVSSKNILYSSYSNITCEDTDNLILNAINNEYFTKYKPYIINVSEYPLYIGTYDHDDKDSKILITNDYENKTCTIEGILINGKIIHKQLFNKNDVIKIRTYLNGKENKICNEVTYRIIDVLVEYEKVVMPEKTVVLGNYKYVLYGNIETKNLQTYIYNSSQEQDNTPIMFITYANHYPVHYFSLINDVEYKYNNIDFYNSLIKNCTIDYDNEFLHLDDYLDDLYTSIIYEYNINNIRDVWFYPNNVYNKDTAQLYKYTNMPLTLDKGLYLILCSNDSENTFCKDVENMWTIKLNTSDTIKKKNIGNVKENIISLLLKYKGIYDFKLKSIDKFGNTIENNSEALIKIK